MNGPAPPRSASALATQRRRLAEDEVLVLVVHRLDHPGVDVHERTDLLPLEVPEPLESIPGLRPKTTRDPFRSFIEIKTHVAPTKKTRKLLTPLQRYSLDQLKVVGIVEGTNIRKALLEDDVGKGYVVGRGEAVGSQGGKIAAIKSDRIIIEETYQDALGKKKVRRITKRLFSADKGGMP